MKVRPLLNSVKLKYLFKVRMNGDLAMHRKYHHKLSIGEHREQILKSGDKHMIEWYNRGDGMEAQLAKQHPPCVFCDEEYNKRLKIMEEDKQLKQMEEQRQQELKIKSEKIEIITPEEGEEIRRLYMERDANLKKMAELSARNEQINEKLAKIKGKVIRENLHFCSFCNVTLRDKEKRKRHLDSKIHKSNAGLIVLEEYPKSCEYCQKKFNDKTHMDIHLETHAHKVKAGIIQVETYPKTCEPCGYEAKTKNTWDIHCKGKKHNLKVTNIETEEVVKVD